MFKICCVTQQEADKIQPFIFILKHTLNNYTVVSSQITTEHAGIKVHFKNALLVCLN